MGKFTIYRILMYELLTDIGDAVVAAEDETQALSLLEEEIKAHLAKVGLEVPDVQLRIRGKIEGTDFTTNKEGVIYAKCSAGVVNEKNGF